MRLLPRSPLPRARLVAGWLLPGTAGLWLACGAAPSSPSSPPSGLASSPRSSAPVGSALSPAVTASQVTSSAPVASTESQTTPCRGADVQLSVAMSTPSCTVLLDPSTSEASSSPPLQITARPLQTRVAPDATVPIAIVFTNTGDAPVTLLLARSPFESLFGTSLDEEGPAPPSAPQGPARRPPPSATAPTPNQDTLTPGFSTSASTLQGESVGIPKLKGGQQFGILGALGPMAGREWTQVTIQGHGHATAHAQWRARGYDPARTYAPPRPPTSTAGLFQMPPTEPLPAADYEVTISLPALRSPRDLWKAPPVRTRVQVGR